MDCITLKPLFEKLDITIGIQDKLLLLETLITMLEKYEHDINIEVERAFFDMTVSDYSLFYQAKVKERASLKSTIKQLFEKKNKIWELKRQHRFDLN